MRSECFKNEMHRSVLLQSVLDGLDLRPGLTVVDATVNGGGHSASIGRLIKGGRLIGIDRDAAAIARARDRLSDLPCRVDLLVGDFRHLDQLLGSVGAPRIDRLLFDLGWSADQLTSGRGFSFQTDEPLLMTYEAAPEAGHSAGPDSTVGAADLINRLNQTALAAIFKDYGAEPFAERIAQAIVATRRGRPIKTTGQLVSIIRQAVPRWYRAPGRRRHPATKVFQALRIAVNDELNGLAEALTKGFVSLSSGGRLAVITFHSGEARIVKDFFRRAVAAGTGSLVTRRAIKPTAAEIKINPRARSATLRLIQKNDQ